MLATIKQEAACASHKNVSEFLLDDAQWAAFQRALDAPPQALPHLKKLMTEPGILD